MRDLRRRALESHKTVSRKAQSMQSSPATSRSNSRAPSRVASGAVSRAGSDDEDESGALSDETSFSVGSLNEVLNSEAMDTTSAWRTELKDRIDEIINRKRSSVQGREKCYATYIHILAAQYAEDEISSRAAELIAAFLKSIKAESSEKETVLALKATGMSLITSPSDQLYDIIASPLKRTISDSTSISAKTAAIHTLGVCTFYGGASDDEILENMAFLLEIIASDGDFISAQDEPAPVTAALEEWGFLTTLATDLSSDLEEALATFTDQLSSSSPEVQIAAGENIALLYERFFLALQEDEESPDSDSSDGEPDTSRLAGAHSAFRNTDELISTLSELASLSTHRYSKKDKKSIRTHFSDILNSVKAPTCGPRYRNAENPDGGSMGSKLVVKIGQDGVMRIDKWWKLHRLQGLRRVLQGGFVNHYESNSVVFESLPIMIENSYTVAKAAKKAVKNGNDGFRAIPGS